MRYVIFLLFVFVISFQSWIAVCQEDESEGGLRVGPGMEVKRIGTTDYVVPKDAKVEKVGNRVRVETTSEYAARKFIESNERFEEVEQSQKKFEAEVKELHKDIADLKKEIEALKARM